MIVTLPALHSLQTFHVCSFSDLPYSQFIGGPNSLMQILVSQGILPWWPDYHLWSSLCSFAAFTLSTSALQFFAFISSFDLLFPASLFSGTCVCICFCVVPFLSSTCTCVCISLCYFCLARDAGACVCNIYTSSASFLESPFVPVLSFSFRISISLTLHVLSVVNLLLLSWWFERFGRPTCSNQLMKGIVLFGSRFLEALKQIADVM